MNKTETPWYNAQKDFNTHQVIHWKQWWSTCTKLTSVTFIYSIYWNPDHLWSPCVSSSCYQSNTELLPSGFQCCCSCCCCWGCQASGGCWSTKRQSTARLPRSRPSGKPTQKIYDLDTLHIWCSQWVKDLTGGQFERCMNGIKKHTVEALATQQEKQFMSASKL